MTHGATAPPYGRGLCNALHPEAADGTHCTRLPHVTADGGAHWRRGTPAPGAVDAWSDKPRMAMSAGGVWKGVGDRLFVSRDHTLTWSEAARFEGKQVRNVAVDGARADSPSVLLASSAADGTRWWFASAADGFSAVPLARWSPGAARLSILPPYDCEIVFVEGHPRRILCPLVGPGDGQGEVVSSSDAGKTWHRFVPPTPLFSIVPLPGGEGAVVGLAMKSSGDPPFPAYRSDDGGETWREWEVASSGTMLRSLAFSADGRMAWLGTAEHGLQPASLEAGERPPTPRQPLAHPRVCELAVAGDKVMYAGRGNGVYRSDDGGAEWRWIGAGVGGFNPRGILFGDGGWMAACDFLSGVQESTDGGRTWSGPDAQPGQSFSRLVGDRGLRVVISDQGVAAMSDGDSWKWSSARPERPCDLAWVSDEEVYALDEGGQVFLTRNAMTWKPVGPGKASVASANSLAARLGEGAVIGEDGIAVWKDGDESWRRIANPSPGAFLEVPRWVGEFLQVAEGRSVLWIDPQSGKTTPICEAPKGVKRIVEFWVDPDSAARVVILDAGGHGWWTRDRGASWEELTAGLVDVDPRFLAVSPDGRIYLGSDGALVSRPLPK